MNKTKIIKQRIVFTLFDGIITPYYNGECNENEKKIMEKIMKKETKKIIKYIKKMQKRFQIKF